MWTLLWPIEQPKNQHDSLISVGFAGGPGHGQSNSACNNIFGEITRVPGYEIPKIIIIPIHIKGSTTGTIVSIVDMIWIMKVTTVNGIWNMHIPNHNPSGTSTNAHLHIGTSLHDTHKIIYPYQSGHSIDSLGWQGTKMPHCTWSCAFIFHLHQTILSWWMLSGVWCQQMLHLFYNQIIFHGPSGKKIKLWTLPLQTNPTLYQQSNNNQLWLQPS